MNSYRLNLAILALILCSACVKLDLDPLSQSATGNFYNNQKELELAVNDLYHVNFWENDNEEYTDNFWHRASGGNAITFGNMDAENPIADSLWSRAYRAIARANSLLENMDDAAESTPEAVMLRIEAEARLARAYQYMRLVTHFGDVPLMTETPELEDAYDVQRTAMETIVDFIFTELDWAAEHLPASYGGDVKRFTKGLAWAIKARAALYTGHWAEARDAAAAVMQLANEGIHGLYGDYRQLFLPPGAISNEVVFSVPRSQEHGLSSTALYARDFISRSTGGYGAQLPTWELMDSYECTDGLPIDQSPLYNPHDPFANRDPRLSMTIVPFGEVWLGVTYQPHPDSLTVWSVRDNQRISNLDNRAVNVFASYTGLLWKKRVDESWVTRFTEDNDAIIFRYAEVLLTYAEAKVELGEVDQSVLDAINSVRARAYGVEVGSTGDYPAVATTDIAALRTLIKRERRVEFAQEGLRYMDLIRWRLAERALTQPVLGLPDPADQDRDNWPFAGAPTIDADGMLDYSALMGHAKILAERNFDRSRQYLWPIPASERRLNPQLDQNPNY
ncbi:RagB/SusD family nutrient uptake outer membrane protein [Parapedobacter deserti]|uniref:RagB/SusD family nutrient uptake outer membrane protein n=1 Tax=Parapedobacter deserti TaxID=1912957 RepID=A0ABV7JJX1_9SPHI